MKTLLAKIMSFLHRLQAILISFGAFGILVIAFLDAALIPIPGGPDAAVMALSHLNHAMMPVYVLAAVVGSTLGCLVPYYIGRAMGEAALRKFTPERRARASELINRYDVWVMLVGAVLPPPFPLKVFLVSAGVFRMSVPWFLVALAIGRSIRFTLEGLAAVYFGDRATDVFRQHYPAIGLGLAVLILLIFLARKFLFRN
ncbi:MAG: YqaA family protein, partial [Blastocatellia bacterium]